MFRRLIVALALALPLISIAEEKPSSPLEKAIVGTAVNGIGGLLVLVDAQDKCKAGQQLILSSKADGTVAHTGCWLVHFARVVVLWDDSDVNLIPANIFQWHNKDDKAIPPKTEQKAAPVVPKGQFDA